MLATWLVPERLRGHRTIEHDGDGGDDNEDAEDDDGERANGNGSVDGVMMLMTLTVPFNGGDDACILRRAPMICPEIRTTAAQDKTERGLNARKIDRPKK